MKAAAGAAFARAKAPTRSAATMKRKRFVFMVARPPLLVGGFDLHLARLVELGAQTIEERLERLRLAGFRFGRLAARRDEHEPVDLVADVLLALLVRGHGVLALLEPHDPRIAGAVLPRQEEDDFLALREGGGAGNDRSDLVDG